VPDTVGYATPAEYGALFRRLIKETHGSDRVIWSAHCHDDLGMATANTLAALEAGARQAEVCVNGIGERAGNTSLEEIVMALHTRHPFYGLTTKIDTVQLARTSKMVANYTGITVPPNKAIVGANAFAHEAGIHQDGMLKDHRTYEIMTPETVGLSHSKLVLGKHSGRHAFRIRLEELGHHLTTAELYPAFQRFKALAEKKKTVTDADLTALIASEVKPESIYSLEDLQVTCGRSGLSTATARVRGPGGVEKIQACVGTGPVDAAYRAIDEIVQAPNTLVEYRVHSVTEGIEALGEVTVRIKSESVDAGRMFSGYGADTDVIAASAQAYVAALNRLLEAQGKGSRGAREIGPATVRAAGTGAAGGVKAVGEAS
jgi:2-isopropylmalate synthase